MSAPLHTTTTTTTVVPDTYTSNPGLVMAAPGAAALPATTTTTTSAAPSTSYGATHHDEHLSKDLSKDQKKMAKEHEKQEKQMHKEQLKHEKELHKQEAKAEKEHLKEEKRLEKERRHNWTTAHKMRTERYRAEEKATLARLRGDVGSWDTTHGQTAPIGYYNEQRPDELPFTDDNLGLFVAIPRARNLYEATEKVDAYAKVLLVGTGPDGKDHVHMTKKTNTIKDNANPEWWFLMDEAPHLLADDHHWLQNGRLRIEVWDHDTFSKDELLGSIEWPLQQLDGRVTRGNFQLQHNPLLTAGKKAKMSTAASTQGSIFVEIRYRSPFAYSGMHTGAPAPVGFGYGAYHHGGMTEMERKHQLGAMHHQTGSAMPLAGSTTYAHVPGDGIVTHSGMPAGGAFVPTGTAAGLVGAGAGAASTAIPVHAAHAPLYNAAAPGVSTGGYVDNDPAHYRHPHHTGAIPAAALGLGHHAKHDNRVEQGSILKNVGPLAMHGEPGYTGVVAPGTAGMQPAPIMGAAPGMVHTTGAPLPPAGTTAGTLGGLPATGAYGAPGGGAGNVSVQVVTDAPASAAPAVAAAALAAAKAAAENIHKGGAPPAYITQPGTGNVVGGTPGIMPGTTTTTTTHIR